MNPRTPRMHGDLNKLCKANTIITHTQIRVDNDLRNVRGKGRFSCNGLAYTGLHVGGVPCN